MEEKSFVQYWYSEDVHDGTINQVMTDADRVRVFVETTDGRSVVFELTGVRDVKQNRPEGMLLYSLTELTEPAPLRRFVFTNWDEEDDACLELVAVEFSNVGTSIN